MAEYVNQTLEEMIPELEEMNRLDLFSTKETKVILKKREKHEYKLRQLTKTKESYVNYIEYELKLLELLKLRRKKTTQDTKNRAIEKAIADRIHNLFRLATTRFLEDLSLWKRHIDFSKAMKEKAFVRRLYERALKLHSRNEELWVEAARWENAGNQNPELARNLLLKGQRINPESELIFLQLFKLELDQAGRVIKRKEVLGLKDDKKEDEEEEENEDEMETSNESERENAFNIVEVIYRNGLQMFPNNPSLHLKLLSFVCSVKEAGQLEEKMVTDLQLGYPDLAQVWNALALRHIHRIGKLGTSGAKNNAIKKCIDSFEETLENLPTEEMWTYALSSVLNISKLSQARTCDWILPKMLSMFERAIQSRTLCEELSLSLLDLLTVLDMGEDVARVAVKCTDLHPKSARLWLARFRIQARQGDIPTEGGATMDKMLKTALKTVPEEESWPLWEFALNQMSATKATETERIMEMACRSICPMVCKPAKEWSLHWTFRQGGIKGVRNVYKSLRCMRPVSLDFFKIYLQIELSQAERSVKRIRSVFEEALAEFGKTQPDLWINYILVERDLDMSGVGQAGTLYHRALQGLNEDLRESFIRKHFSLEMKEQ